MTRVYHAFVLHLITTQLGDFLELELVTPAVATHIRTLLTSANHALLTDSIALVDAFDHDDYSLDSELGRFDGRVYAALWARKDRVCTDWDQSRMNGLAKSIRLSKL
jgi:acyl-CoA oxidase